MEERGTAMRFLHTADWHLGKHLHGYDLLEDQHAAFEQIEAIAKQERVDAVVIAGDLYDRAVPGEKAVAELNAQLRQLNLSDHLPVLAISGNHDSAVRLATGQDWYRATDFYLTTNLAEALKPVVIKDTQFFLLPYFELQEARNLLGDQSLRLVDQALARLVTKMKEHFAPGLAHVLVAHFFAAGASHTDSETKVEVGGLNAVPVDLLTEFDYVALGHLHNPNALHEERVRYAGSPLKFSASEVGINKGVWIVDTAPFGVKWVPLTPLHELVKLTGAFSDLATSKVAANYRRDDFFVVELTDSGVIPNVMARLREYYPRVVQLVRQPGQLTVGKRVQVDPTAAPLTLLQDFYATVTDGQSLTKDQLVLAKEALKKVEGEN